MGSDEAEAISAGLANACWCLDGRWAIHDADGIKLPEQFCHTAWHYDAHFTRRGDFRRGMPIHGRSDSEHGWAQALPMGVLLEQGHATLDWPTGRVASLPGSSGARAGRVEGRDRRRWGGNSTRVPCAAPSLASTAWARYRGHRRDLELCAVMARDPGAPASRCDVRSDTANGAWALAPRARPWATSSCPRGCRADRGSLPDRPSLASQPKRTNRVGATDGSSASGRPRTIDCSIPRVRSWMPSSADVHGHYRAGSNTAGRRDPGAYRWSTRQSGIDLDGRVPVRELGVSGDRRFW